MRSYKTLLVSACMLATLTACEKNMIVEGAEEGNSVLSVVTRTGDGVATISYPVTVYVMNSSGVCVRKQVLTSASDQLSMNMQAATYHVYAVGGAGDDDYSLPDKENATATTALTLKTGALHADLMAGDNTVTLGENESNTLTLSLSRKVMELKSVEIKNIPNTVDGVSIVLSPLYDNLLLNGTYSTTTSAQTVTLIKQSDGTTWKNAAAQYLLPASGSATIAVKLTTGTTTTSYTYNCPEPLQANYHINITVTYVNNTELTLTGVISGATWAGTTNIEFSFDGSGSTTTTNNDNSSPTDDDVEEGSAPAKDTWYKDCYVIDSKTEGDYTTVTLLHRSELEMDGSDKEMDDLEGDINAALPTFTIQDITGWRLPTEAEARKILIGKVNLDIANHNGTPMSSSDWYYLKEGGEIRAFSGTRYDNEFTWGNRLRPVTTLKFNK